MALLLSLAGCGGESAKTVSEARDQTAGYLTEQVPEAAPGSIGGEWTVLGLARGEAEVPDGYYETYYDNVRAAVKSKKGVLDERNYTEYSRVSIGLAAIGKDPRDVEGYNLLEPLDRAGKVIGQGVNGPIFALIAANCCGYELDKEQRYLDYILNAQLEDGGFSLSGEGESSPDLTGMALQALSFYKDDEKAGKAIERAVDALAAARQSDGTFDGSSETVSQVIIGLTSVGIDPRADERFVKEDADLYDVLMKYCCEDGGFSHKEGEDANLMASEQAMCALDALILYEDGNCLYRCSN